MRLMVSCASCRHFISLRDLVWLMWLKTIYISQIRCEISASRFPLQIRSGKDTSMVFQIAKALHFLRNIESSSMFAYYHEPVWIVCQAFVEDMSVSFNSSNISDTGGTIVFIISLFIVWAYINFVFMILTIVALFSWWYHCIHNTMIHRMSLF